MLNNPPSWAQFYFELHRSAERLKAMMENAPTIPTGESEKMAEATEANQSTRPANHSHRRKIQQVTGASK